MSKDKVTYQSLITLAKTKASAITDSLTEGSLITESLTLQSPIGIEDVILSNWILLDGIWNDSGVWEDDAIWID